MQVQQSNMVYVVSLGRMKPDGCNLSYVDIVKQYNKYFHPLGVNGWPKEPPNYIAFRYDGELQAIHHIESYVVTKNLHVEIDAMPNWEEENECFVYSLGTAILPSKETRTGEKIKMSRRVWCMLDTLLTCDTISDAEILTKQRNMEDV